MTHHLLTFLFTDLENSTSLWEQFPDEMQSASARHDVLMRAIIERHHGRVVKTTGDGFHAAFESPLDGIAAALAGQQALTAEPWPEATGQLKVRMGLHTGESQERDGDFYGSNVNLAARVMGLGYGGQILLSEVTATLIKNHPPQECTLLDLGEHRLKGIAEPEQIFQLCHPDLVAEFPPLKSLATFKHNLHRQLSSFIGREKELADVKRLLKETQLLTLLGPGGTGKTRLMLQVAEEVIEDYPDGVWLVELAPLTDPNLIPERVASTLNIQEQSGRPILDTLTDYLRRKELLLLLDNVEHLVRASAEFAEHLLAQCPKLTILVTGREALFIDGETTIQIPSLSIPKEIQTLDEITTSEGVQLFIERARAVRPDFVINEKNAATVAEIVRRLDGIPLALELAAARLRMLTVEQIAARLNDRFRLLTGGRRTALPRQQTLQALIDWSWQLLDDQEHVLLRRLSVFSGGWALEAAQAIAGFDPLDEFEVFDALEQLINKSLVIVRYLPEGEARYNMLESIRQFAQDKLFAAGEGEMLRDRHVDYFVALVDQFGQSGVGSEFFAWMKRFSLESDNLRAVVEWIAEDYPQLALHFTGILLQYDPIWLPYREARSWLEPVIEHARILLEDPATDLVMKDFIIALQSLGWLLVTHGDMLNGHSLLDECIRLAREFGEFRILAVTMGMKAQAMGSTVTQEVIEQLEEIIDICRQNNYEIELLMALFSAGQAYIVQGHLDKGRAYLAEVIQLMAIFDVPIINTWVYYIQALLERATENTIEAEKYFLQAIEANEKWGHRRMVATARSELAHLYRKEKRLDKAMSLYRQTILSWQEQGHQSAVAHQLECFAYLAIAWGQTERAARLLGAAQHARHQLNALSTEPQEIADFEQSLAQLTGALGEERRDKLMTDGAKMSLDEAVTLALEEKL
jgi:predicted ATPase/class 3 adenylate cyclase